jgi:hypothetical protein
MIPWWTNQQSNLFGGIAGSAFGILGGIIGIVGGYCVPRGKCKPLVYALFALMLGAGIISLAAGFVALLLHQPYAVYYPLLMIGIISIPIAGGLIPVVRRRYREADRRRLEAEELRRS